MEVTITMDRSEIYCRFVLEYPKEVEEARAAEEACIQQLITYDCVFVSVFDSVLMIIVSCIQQLLPLTVSLSLSLILY